ncbi:MAG TPA: FAD-binding and (Fe-S)-binding domain-containing protein [Casimicrobiaceae bacterium]|nr:FAD-binding and (Fe-S)-binding domain-containing protein [Casimicrobiaceae bacterium]
MPASTAPPPPVRAAVALPARHVDFAHALASPHRELHDALARFVPRERLVTDPLRLLAWGTDASFYRLVPKLAVVVETEDEVVGVLGACARLRTPVTFRAAGTSLSGQAVSDSVLVLLGDNWNRCSIAADASSITLGPAVLGAAANRRLAPHGRKIGPDPASIDSAMIGGIAANNASGMCCGTAHNSYRTLAAMRLVLADGTRLDTGDAASRSAFARARPDLVDGLRELRRTVRDDPALAARIRHKYRMKNTTGYSLNALVDFDDPVDILAHLMIGSEGTLGFIAEVTLATVADPACKATALILFDDLRGACDAVSRLARAPVDAVELADRAALRSVQGKPGLPPQLAALGPDGAALLVETRATDAGALDARIAACEAALAGVAGMAPARFSRDPAECARLWAVRKGMFPSVGAMRRAGTTVIIEDVAFPVDRLADATLDLRSLLHEHGYDEAIIFGHALEGNLHFVFTQDFGTATEVERYRAFMDAVCTLVVDRYDGSLKAEHGTGRNMAPYVELEWGPHAYALMRRIKALLDPGGLLNPGVVLDDDPLGHVKHLKALPAVDPLVDKCTECGFCEPQCPSRGLTLSPRQRIVGWRAIAGSPGGDDALPALYRFHGLDTCAACGLCATACPVGIETGLLVKALRGRSAGAASRRIASLAADHFGGVTRAVRVGLAAADAAHGWAGAPAMRRVLDALRRASGARLPKWSAAYPRPVRFRPPASPPGRRGTIVYFPSCAARSMGAQRGDDEEAPLPDVAHRLFERAGYGVRYPAGMDALCCGQPFESKGLGAAADAKAAELEAALRVASDGGRHAIVFDTSPCAYRMKRHLAGRLRVLDVVEFLHDAVLPALPIRRIATPVAVHPVCSVRKMGLADTLVAVAGACAEHVVRVDAVQCCGFAGDRGFTRPELNEHALRHLRAALPADCREGYASSRTCEIGLSEQAGFAYRSIVRLVERGTRAGGSGEATPSDPAAAG